ncbi:hypothetical protein [Micromonospora zhanjiangensis]
MRLFKRKEPYTFTPEQAAEILRAAREDDAEERAAARNRLLEQARQGNPPPRSTPPTAAPGEMLLDESRYVYSWRPTLNILTVTSWSIRRSASTPGDVRWTT